MASPLDSTQFQYALKINFPKGIPWSVYADENAPFLALVDKDPKGGGRYLSVPVEYASISGRSSDIDKARANQHGQEGKEFQLPWRRDYAVFAVDRLTMLQSEGNENAIVEAWSRTLKHAMSRIKRSLAHGVTGDGSGAIGKVAAISGTTVTLEAAASVILLEKNDTIQANPNRSGNAGTMRAGTGVVNSISRQRGVFTFTAVGGFSPSVGDYLYIEGDYDARVAGVQAWVPFTEPAAGDNFFGVDRSVDSTRLAGLRVDASAAGGILDAVQGGLSDFRREGATPTHIFVSQDDFTVAMKEAETRRIVTEAVVNEYQVGIKGIRMGNAVLVGDMYFPSGYAYPLNLPTWTYSSVREAPHIVDDDGLEKRRATTGDSFSGEMASYSNLKCEEPGQNGVIKLPQVR